ncbi:MAG TPA: hypothetical protein VGI77_11860 [Gaiellaceae bacterium]
MRTRLFGLTASVLFALLAMLVLGAATAASKPGPAKGEGTPKFTTDGGTSGFRTGNTVKYWSSSFFDPHNQQTYSYTMVGTPPSSGTTTTVNAVIIPLAFHFSAAGRPDPGLICDPSGTPGTCVAQDVTMDPTNDPNNGGPTPNDVTNVINSPIFATSNYAQSGDTGVQYGDAIQRSEFNVVGSSYHVNLAYTHTYPVQTIDVPGNQGVAVINRRGVLVGRVDDHWYSNKLQSLINSLHLDPTVVPIFLNANVYLYDNNDQINGCCILGYHGARTALRGNGAQAVQTYIFAAYITPGSFGGYPDVPIADIHGLSHEVSEWMNDPFVNNIVEPWAVPTATQYGCTAYLETGDPVVGIGFPQTTNGFTYHPEDEVFLPWFARQVPSSSQDGKYTFMNTFTTENKLAPAASC